MLLTHNKDKHSLDFITIFVNTTPIYTCKCPAVLRWFGLELLMLRKSTSNSCS